MGSENSSIAISEVLATALRVFQVFSHMTPFRLVLTILLFRCPGGIMQLTNSVVSSPS
jgi:hypothetical protein